MYLSEQLNRKWEAVLDHEAVPAIDNDWKRFVTGVVLENTEKLLQTNRQGFLEESAPVNNIGGGNIGTYDPILISLIRRAMPNLIAYDIAGVQPMTGPSGIIFALRARYKNQSGTEALFNEANTAFSGTNSLGANGNVFGSVTNTNPVFALTDNTTYGVGRGMTTAQGEALGDSATNLFQEMAFTIDRVTVKANERALKGDYSIELAQDLKAIHGLDAETELSNFMSTQMLAEINREVVRVIYRSASLGAQYGVTTAGTFDLDTDSNGRWSVEKFKGLLFQIERDANAIAKATRRGKGNIVIVSSDVASALSMAGILDYAPALKTDLTVDDTGITFAGVINGRLKVYIDPYFGGSTNGDELACVGYKGTASPFDAGIFYCPYVPMQFIKTVDPTTLQPVLGAKTRYGLVANPFATTAGDGFVGDRDTASNANVYYRIFRIRNLT